MVAQIERRGFIIQTLLLFRFFFLASFHFFIFYFVSFFLLLLAGGGRGNLVEKLLVQHAGAVLGFGQTIGQVLELVDGEELCVDVPHDVQQVAPPQEARVVLVVEAERVQDVAMGLSQK